MLYTGMTDGNTFNRMFNYTDTCLNSNARILLLILRSHQGQALAPIYASFNCTNYTMYFSNITNASWNSSTKTLTVKTGIGWGTIVILTQRGYIY